MKIAVLTGGEGFEREVSLKSVGSVEEWVEGVDRFVLPEELERFKQRATSFDVVIPMIHGEGGEDGGVNRLCEELGVSCLFSSAEVHQLAFDKTKTKTIVNKIGVQVPTTVSSLESISGSVIVKPNLGGSSEFTFLCENHEEAKQKMTTHPGVDFILEEVLPGREFTVGVVETGGELKALEVIEIIPKGLLFDYASKYNEDQLAEEICPADISTELKQKLQQAALKVHLEIGCKHLSRSDFRLNAAGEPVFLEVNTIPGMTSTSLVPKAVAASGLTMSDLFTDWIAETLARSTS